MPDPDQTTQLGQPPKQPDAFPRDLGEMAAEYERLNPGRGSDLAGFARYVFERKGQEVGNLERKAKDARARAIAAEDALAAHRDDTRPGYDFKTFAYTAKELDLGEKDVVSPERAKAIESAFPSALGKDHTAFHVDYDPDGKITSVKILGLPVGLGEDEKETRKYVGGVLASYLKKPATTPAPAEGEVPVVDFEEVIELDREYKTSGLPNILVNAIAEYASIVSRASRLSVRGGKAAEDAQSEAVAARMEVLRSAGLPEDPTIYFQLTPDVKRVRFYKSPAADTEGMAPAGTTPPTPPAPPAAPVLVRPPRGEIIVDLPEAPSTAPASTQAPAEGASGTAPAAAPPAPAATGASRLKEILNALQNAGTETEPPASGS